MAEAARSPKSVSSPRPWLCAAMNQLAFPGLGTIMAGRWIGYVQATIMVAGFCLFVGFMVYYFWCFMQFAISDWSEDQLRAAYGRWLWALWTGLGLCALAWCWALGSSIGIVRRAQSSSSPRIR